METFEFAGFTWPRHIARLVSKDYLGTPEPLSRPAGKRHRYKVDTGYYSSPWPIVDGHPKTEDGFYLDYDFEPGLRWKWCDNVDGIRIDHRDWWTYDDGSGEKIRGVVWRLPHGRGFLAGHAMGEGMWAALSRRIWKSEQAAACEADQMAEVCAEEERDYHRAYDAGQEARILEAEVRVIRGKLVTLLAQLRRVRESVDLDAPAVCEALKEKVQDMLDFLGEKGRKLDKLKAENTWPKGAFDEGFGCG